MKKFGKTIAILLVFCTVLTASACKNQSESIKDTKQPAGISTRDEAEIPEMTNAVETSANVNGLRFTLDIFEFTQNYNSAKKTLQQNDLIFYGNWRKQGESETDDNGVEIQYYYYDDINVSFTATVEVKSGKIMNIGCGTTMSTFMGQTDGGHNSDLIPAKAALMAQTVCQFPEESREVLQDIFFRITTESNDTLWYKGFVFHLSTKEDPSDSKNNIMLFRVFPISQALREEWKLEEY